MDATTPTEPPESRILISTFSGNYRPVRAEVWLEGERVGATIGCANDGGAASAGAKLLCEARARKAAGLPVNENRYRLSIGLKAINAGFYSDLR